MPGIWLLPFEQRGGSSLNKKMKQPTGRHRRHRRHRHRRHRRRRLTTRPTRILGLPNLRPRLMAPPSEPAITIKIVMMNGHRCHLQAVPKGTVRRKNQRHRRISTVLRRVRKASPFPAAVASTALPGAATAAIGRRRTRLRNLASVESPRQLRELVFRMSLSMGC